MKVRASKLLGRTVRDRDGRDVGKIEELHAEIEQHAHGNDYVVTHVALGRLGVLDIITTGWFVPEFVKRWRARVGYRRYEIPWEWLDLADPEHPRLSRAESELRAET